MTTLEKSGAMPRGLADSQGILGQLAGQKRVEKLKIDMKILDLKAEDLILELERQSKQQ